MKLMLPTLLTLFAFIMFAPALSAKDHHDSHSKALKNRDSSHHDKSEQSHHKEYKSGRDTLVKGLFVPTEDLKIRIKKILDLKEELEIKKENTQNIKAYGEKFKAIVDDIFKTCTLEPEADEALHPILAQIIEGSTDLKNKNYKEGHGKIHKALMRYKKNFHENK